jgi:acetyl-CoA carboxylase biotin carboxyl carrier protein
MAPNQNPSVAAPFDVETVRMLAKIMSRHDLNEIDLFDGDRRIRLRRGLRNQAHTVAPAPMPLTAPAPPPPAKPEKNLIPIKSELIGTFYTRPKPDSEPFVTVGSRVSPTTTVCVIEAMKIFTEVPAGVTGTIAQILVENSQHVEYGTVLFLIEPTG